jgi:hypothetical protein
VLLFRSIDSAVAYFGLLFGRRHLLIYSFVP